MASAYEPPAPVLSNGILCPSRADGKLYLPGLKLTLIAAPPGARLKRPLFTLSSGRQQLFKSRSAAVYGIDAHIIDVEVDFAGFKTEQEQFNTVGLPDAAVRESRDRVRSAIKNSGFDLPTTRITINLAPADIQKAGSGFDLPIAIGILGAYGALHTKDISDFLLVGELGLDGGLRAVQGMLPIAIAARAAGIKNLVIPASTARAAAVGEGVDVYPVHPLLEVRELLNSASFGTIAATPLKIEAATLLDEL